VLCTWNNIMLVPLCLAYFTMCDVSKVHLCGIARIPFLDHSTVWMCHIFAPHSSVHEHLGCFCLLVIMNNVPKTLCVQVSVWVPTFNSFGYIPGVEFLDHMFQLPEELSNCFLMVVTLFHILASNRLSVTWHSCFPIFDFQ
jgi:hypothetical protein